MKNAFETIYTPICYFILGVLAENLVNLRVLQLTLSNDYDIDVPLFRLRKACCYLYRAGYLHYGGDGKYALSDELLSYDVDPDFDPMNELTATQLHWQTISEDTKWIFKLWCQVGNTPYCMYSDGEYSGLLNKELRKVELHTEKELVDHLTFEILVSGFEFDIDRKTYWPHVLPCF